MTSKFHFNFEIYSKFTSFQSIDMNSTSLDALLRFPMSSKPMNGAILLNSVADAFKDVKLSENVRNKTTNQNPFQHNVNQLREILKVDKKSE